LQTCCSQQNKKLCVSLKPAFKKITYCSVANYRPHSSQCRQICYLVTFCLCIYLLKPNSLTANIPIFKSLLTRSFFTCNILKMCNSVLITVLKMQSHYKTPSSGTSTSTFSSLFLPLNSQGLIF